MYIYKFAVLFLLATITVVYTNCGSQGKLAWQSNQMLAGSEEGFESTVYPITRANCASCHETQSPQHASPDPDVAHAAAYSKVNFGNIPNSRLVKKLRDEHHNCWSNCEENADEMEAAIEAWYAAVQEEDKQSPTPIIQPPTTTPMLKTSSTRTISEELADITNVAKSPTAEAKVLNATLTAPMVRAKDSIGDFFHVPSDGVANELAIGAANAGLATFNVRLPAAGTYRIYGYVVAADASSNSVFAGIAPQGNPTAYIGGLRTSPEITVNANPMWRQIVSNINVTAAGNYTVAFKQKEDGLKIYRVFVTADGTFNGNDVASYVGVRLSFDVSTLVSQPAGTVFFSVDVSDYSTYSYLVSNPRITTSALNIRVKNIRLMVNGIFNPQNSTYLTVDKVSTPTAPQLSGFPMIVLKDKGVTQDKFHFEFEMIEVYNGTVNNASLMAFQTSVYPISLQNCASCHTGQVPRHASPDPLTAHDAALTIVDFNNPAASRIVTKIRNGHQGIPASVATQYEAAIVQWRTGRGP